VASGSNEVTAGLLPAEGSVRLQTLVNPAASRALASGTKCSLVWEAPWTITRVGLVIVC